MYYDNHHFSYTKKSFILLLFTIFFVATLSDAAIAQGNMATDTHTPDAYERIESLIDSIRSWSQSTIPQSISREISSKNMSDTLNLMEFFSGASIESDDTTGTITIFLPTYMDFVNTSLKFSVIAEPDFDHRLINWHSPIAVSGDSVRLDNEFSPSLSNLASHPVLLQNIGDRLIQLRTLGLSEIVKAHPIVDDSLRLNLTIRSRNTEKIEIKLHTFIETLRRLSTGMLVYVGILEASDNADNADNATIKYYLLLTSPKATGHHFLEWEEKISASGEVWKTISVQVVLTPYVRTDNLKSLFDK